MAAASELRAGMVIQLEGETYKVIGAEHHAGGGKLGGVVHAKLRSLRSGAVREWRFRTDEPVTQLETDRQLMDFLYAEGSVSNFMNPQTFEQVAVENALLGRAAAFLAEGMSLAVEFLDGAPVGVAFPDIVELSVAECAPPMRTQGNESVWKEATLENGVKIMVPPFIAPGERVRVHVQDGTYLARAKDEKKK